MTGRLEQLLNDNNWEEVESINHYAVLMGYLSMAIKGLGFLVLTWTTVVLLGGFVSMLHKKDFWSLTFITLVQTAGIFDVVLNEKLRYIGDALITLLGKGSISVMGTSSPDYFLAQITRLLLAYVFLLVQLLVLAAVLCPLAVIYVLGILISAGISLWRLIEHNYSNSESNGEASNLAPAMDTLYYLALLQGVLFFYRFVLRRIRDMVVKEVANENYKCNDSDAQVVYNYLYETRRGCEKDPSFVKGRNLITVAVDKIGSSSPIDCISGVKMLYTAICIVERKLNCLIKDGENYEEQRDILSGQRMLMKHLVLSASSKHILQKLLETLDSIGVHDRETRNQAAVIVKHLASNINLEEFPRGIQHISSLIETFQEYSIAEPYQREYKQHWFLTPSPTDGDDAGAEPGKAYKELVLRGLRIIRDLAADGNNCRVMSDTPDLVSRIMAPVTFDLLDHTTEDHGAWSNIVKGSIEVMRELVTTPGEIGAKLRRQISSCKEATNTLRRILGCNACKKGPRKGAIWILTRLYIDAVERNISTDFVMMLLDIFIHDNNSSVRGYTGGALSEICFHGGTSHARIIIQTSGDVVYSLTKVLLHEKNEKCREAAAEILEYLWTHYTKDDEYLDKLKQAMTHVMSKVLGEIIHCGYEMHTGKEAEKDMFPKTKTDIENQCDGTKENDEQKKESQADEKPIRSVNLLSSLLSLCGTVYGDSIGELGLDLSPPLNTSSFVNKLKEMVVKKSDPTIRNLLVFKAIAKIVISMMKKHRDNRFVKQEDLVFLTEALSTASKDLQDLDYSMVFRSSDRFKITLSKLNRHTLASLVKEAKDLHVMVASTSASS
ncbi:hypothetical protein ACQJBY_039384 [Aegilops geniculata]